MNRFFSKAYLLVFLPALLAVTGCGKKTGEVSGTVTFKGKPLPMGKIVFSDGKRSGSGDIFEGKYTVEKAPAGDNIKVTINTQSAVQMVLGHEQAEQLFRQRYPNYDEMKKRRKFSELPQEMQDAMKEARLDPESVKFIQKIKDNAAQLTIPQSVQQVDETPIKLKVSSGSQDIDINLDDYK
jgi:hypothetical protein